MSQFHPSLLVIGHRLIRKGVAPYFLHRLQSCLTNMVDAVGTTGFGYFAGGLLASEDGH